jgi:hypothetical protein
MSSSHNTKLPKLASNPWTILHTVKKLGTLGPSTNTIVQPDFDDLRPVGVTNHYSRIAIPNDPVTDDASFLKLVNSINQATMDAVDVFAHLRHGLLGDGHVCSHLLERSSRGQ